MNPMQIDAIKRLEKTMSMRDGSASECHEYYCPYNIGCLVDHIALNDAEKEMHDSWPIPLRLCDSCRIDDDGNIHEDDHGIYRGKPDGFDSECPRFLAIDREKGKWECLCGLEVIARLLGESTWNLYKELLEKMNKKDEKTFPEILGFNPRWRHLNLETGEREKQ
nr:hypothetical protein [Candidatus Sigynarchaeota archaeon]